MGKVTAQFVVFLLVLSIAGTTRAAPPKPSAIFAFGDSYADTGNRNHNSSSWHYPYGVTWPGYPTGRFGNGHIQTDFLADKLGMPAPTPYADIANQSIANGVNFALGGSGVTYALGQLPLNTQLDNFELLWKMGAWSPSFLADSLTLLSNVGNDYNRNYTTQELEVVVQEVAQGLLVVLKRMYDLGLRNILVANLPPLNCVPEITLQSNYTTCEASLAPLVELHNNLLLQSVQTWSTLPNANFLVLKEMDAFTYVLNNTKEYGITEILTPCCKPLNASQSCGSVDALGNPLYTLCANPELYVYWDSVHPVESTWKHVVDLFYNRPGFVIGASTLESWLYESSVRPSAPALAPGVAVSRVGAIGQLEAAYGALLTEPDYYESLGLLQAVNLRVNLAGLPNETVTVFLPNNLAYENIPATTISLIYGTDQVLSVGEFHVVTGYYNSTQLSGSVQNLTTISGLDLRVTPSSNQILVGPENAIVVNPDLFQFEGQLVIHGIGQLLIPPGLPQ